YFDCYAGANHQVDVCVTTREFPLNVGIDKILHAVWDGRIAAPDRDVAGNPTAQSYFAAGFVLYFEDE
ncbi:MAG: hypothetical protein JF615_15325, partial [Asticcacaulis sp.]|nr:hypothetical protein [Asticcacaulis sp.]